MGLQFLDIFRDWANGYDETVQGNDPQYADVFAGYEAMLDEVVLSLRGHVLEFGAGTGNLSAKIHEAGHELTAIEPSPEMRAVFTAKWGRPVHDGDFLSFTIDRPVDTIVSSYAFHHLTDEEKMAAITRYATALNRPRFVVLDTMHASPESKAGLLEWASEQGFEELREDLEREFYPYVSDLEEMLRRNGYEVTKRQLNRFVWLIVAETGGDV